MTNLVEKRSELIKTDLVAAADEFKWLNERGVELDLYDAEEDHDWSEGILSWCIPAVAELKDKVTELKALSKEYSPDKHTILTDLFKSRKQLERLVSLKAYAESVNSYSQDVFDRHSAVHLDDPDTTLFTDKYNTTHWNAVYAEWDAIYDFALFNFDRLSLGYWAVVFEILEDKRTRREICFQHYVKLGSYLASKLGWQEEIARFKNMNDKLLGEPAEDAEPQDEDVEYFDGQYYTGLSFTENDMIHAVDMRAAAKRAGRNVYDLLSYDR